MRTAVLKSVILDAVRFGMSVAAKALKSGSVSKPTGPAKTWVETTFGKATLIVPDPVIGEFPTLNILGIFRPTLVTVPEDGPKATEST